MNIYHVPSLQDNYSYLIVDESTKEGAVVDPVEPEKVLEAANSHGVNLKLVLTTHYHGHYPASLSLLLNTYCCLMIPDVVEPKCHPFSSPISLSFININCFSDMVSHTKGHISYYVTGKEEKQPAVFTGDALFVAGCGKFFEGTAEQMYQSLCVTLGSLPKPTRVYCGHEYAVKNLQFALTIEPDKSRMQQKLAWAQNQKQADQPTIPSTIEEEMETNPFMRVDLPAIQEKVGCKSPVEALRELRKLKDNWKG
ncbi:Hydroxyacylglutathione hydrolase [Spatholobus suberectus]|nr:Hydroxyacylglutathione hydrolase [Spatholobus suberectus]